MYKLSEGLQRAFKHSASIARYSDGVGVVPTHAGGGTHVDGHLVGNDELMLHERAHRIVANFGGKMTYAHALEIAQKELDAEALAAKNAPKFSEYCALSLHEKSILIDCRAKEIMRENNLSNARFGEALRQSRAEYASADRVAEYARVLLALRDAANQ